MFFWDPTFIIILPGLVFSLFASFYVDLTFKKYAQIPAECGYSGLEMARLLAERLGLTNIKIKLGVGFLGDYYDPLHRILSLSPEVYSGRSVASLGVAAHEMGHAAQQEKGYLLLPLRTALVPAVNFSTTIAYPLFFIGFLFGSGTMMDIGIYLFGIAVLFSLITLPIEFNASNRAVALLYGTGLLNSREISGVKKVLFAAALTYVAALIVSLLSLLRLLLLRKMSEK